MTFTWKHATLFKTLSLGKRRWSKWKRLGNSWDSKGKMNQRNSSCFSASTFRNIGIWRESVVFLVGGSFESLTMNWVFFFQKMFSNFRKVDSFELSFCGKILMAYHVFMSGGALSKRVWNRIRVISFVFIYGGMKIPCLPFSWVGVHDMYIQYIYMNMYNIYTWHAIIYLILYTR